MVITTRVLTTSTGIYYTYDPLDRLTGANYTGAYAYAFAYGYDAVGNRTVQTRTITNTQVVNYVYDNANRLTSANGQAYTWDNNGNLLSDGTSVYSYTQANYLKALSQGATAYNYTYNGDGARLKQLAGTTATTYTLDLAAGLVQVLAQQQAGTTTQYLYGASRIGERTPGTVAYHLADALGSVRQLTDGSGVPTLAQNYEPYGDVLNSYGTGTTVYGFTGEQRDATGLEYLRARYYAPGQGRFFQHDSWPGDILQPQSLNRFAYAFSDPIRYSDPTGQCPTPPTTYGPTICFALFIKPDRVSVAGGLWTLHGDGRDFSDHSDPSASRGYIWIRIDEPNNKYAHMNPTGYLQNTTKSVYPKTNYFSPSSIEWFQPSSQNLWDVRPSGNGEITMEYDLVLAGFLENIAPHINGTITFRPDGRYRYTAFGERDGFPWAEAYYHDGQGYVQTIFQRPAIRANPEDLNAIEKTYPFEWWRTLYYLRARFADPNALMDIMCPTNGPR